MKKGLIILLCLMLCACTTTTTTTETKTTSSDELADFDQYVNDYMISSLEDDYTAIHQYFEHPEDYGINMDDVEIGFGDVDFGEEAIKESLEEVNEVIAGLEKYDYDSLTDEQKETYDILMEDLTIQKNGLDEKFCYVGDLFTTMDGVHYSLATFFTNWELRNEEDVENLPALIRDVRRYMDACLDYTKVQNEKGTITTNCEEVIAYCQNIVDTGMDSAVLAVMEERIQAVDMDEDKKQECIEEVEDAFKSYFIPAYQDVVDTLTEINNNFNGSDEGLYYVENGAEYYQQLIESTLGLNYTIDEVETILTNVVNKYSEMAQEIYNNNPDVIATYFSGVDTGYNSYDEILEALAEFTKNDIPDVGKINYTAVDIDPGIAVDGIYAYFLIPAVDSTTPRQIKVNTSDGSSDVSSLETFVNVAHEGIPGHMYQFEYAYQNLDSLYRKIGYFSLGYIEGYARYAEYNSYYYVTDEDTAGFYVSQDEILYGMIVLADIGIHYHGWTFDDALSFVNNNGYEFDEESFESIYIQLRDNPAVFVPYTVGYAILDDFRDQAKEALGDKYTDLGFNTAILKSGTVPFEIVEKNVDEYIGK